jgi:anti-anti-sigma factor
MRNNEMNEETAIPESSKAVIEPEGDLISISLPPLRSKMREMVGAGVRHLTVDLAKVQMVDSAGLGLLMSAHNSLRKTGGQLAVIHASEDILQLFQTMRFHQHFSVSGN